MSSKVHWPHAPPHFLNGTGTFMVTAATLHHEHFFSGPDGLEFLHNSLLNLAKEFHWRLEAWAVFSNHYHFIGKSPASSAVNLGAFIAALHTSTARWVNARDATLNRKVWHNYWETQLTYQHSYLARLNYVNHNAVHHGLVSRATDYPWCSAAWFEANATYAQVQSVYRIKYDKVRVIECEPERG